MPDRLSEHPNLIICVTNMAYKTAPGLMPRPDQEINWIDFPLSGNTAIEFEHQIENKIRSLEADDAWEVPQTIHPQRNL